VIASYSIDRRTETCDRGSILANDGQLPVQRAIDVQKPAIATPFLQAMGDRLLLKRSTYRNLRSRLHFGERGAIACYRRDRRIETCDRCSILANEGRSPLTRAIGVQKPAIVAPFWRTMGDRLLPKGSAYRNLRSLFHFGERWAIANHVRCIPCEPCDLTVPPREDTIAME